MGGDKPDADEEFREFVTAERAALLRFAVSLTADRGLAEDLVQVALINCYPRWTKIRREAPGRYVRAMVHIGIVQHFAGVRLFPLLQEELVEDAKRACEDDGKE